MATTRTARRKPRITGWGAVGLAAAALAAAGWLQEHPTAAWALAINAPVGAIGWVLLRRRTRSAVKRRRAARDGRRFLALKPTAFEHAVAELAKGSGVDSAQRVGGSGDLGADVVGWDRRGRKVVIQCKRYAPDHAVGSQDVQRFVGTAMPHHRADVAVLVTTSRFTKPALDYAHQQGVRTVDGEQLEQWRRSGYAPFL
jgi:HJR/Mrr/RecB family endonuclease